MKRKITPMYRGPLTKVVESESQTPVRPQEETNEDGGSSGEVPPTVVVSRRRKTAPTKIGLKQPSSPIDDSEYAFAIPTSAFNNVAEEIIAKLAPEFSMNPDATSTLQRATEALVVDRFSDADLISKTEGRTTALPKDLKLAGRVRGC